MKKNSIIKTVSVLILLITIICISTVCFAGGDSDPISNPDFYKPKTLTTNDTGDFLTMVGTIIGAFQLLGTFLTVLILMALGIKYMLGSTEDKAAYKETMIPYLIGAIMVFTIPNVIGIIFNLVKEIE